MYQYTTRTEVYPHDARYLIALMRELGPRWEANSGEYLRWFEKPPHQPQYWRIEIESTQSAADKNKFAKMTPYAQFDGTTKVVFVDGWDSDNPQAIGPAFTEFVDWLVGQWGEQQTAASTNKLPPIEDPTDQRIWDLVRDDPDLSDSEIGQKLNISRQATNTRRMRLKAMGYQVR